MRIVYLHQYFNTRIGGTRSYEMARRLVANGHQVHMITSDRNPDPEAPRDWRQSNEDGIDVHWLPVPYANQMGYRDRLRAFAKFAWAACGRAASLPADLIFATSTPLTIAIPGMYASRRNRIPMVLEVRDLWPEVPIAMGALTSRTSIAAAQLLERTAYRHATRVVALSPTMKAGVARTGYPQGCISVIPNACDLELFRAEAKRGKRLRKRYSWLGDRPLVVYAGTLGRVNGVDYIARLAAEVRRIDPTVCFVVIGDGREEAAVRGVAHRLGVLGRNFFMLPPVAKSVVAQWLSTAQMAMSVVIDIPALWGNSANKVFDGFAAGIPVAINHEGWLADTLRDHQAGLVLPPGDLLSAATKLTTALRTPDWLAVARQAASGLASTYFARDDLARQLESVLLEALSEGHTPQPVVPAPAVHAQQNG